MKYASIEVKFKNGDEVLFPWIEFDTDATDEFIEEVWQAMFDDEFFEPYKKEEIESYGWWIEKIEEEDK